MCDAEALAKNSTLRLRHGNKRYSPQGVNSSTRPSIDCDECSRREIPRNILIGSASRAMTGSAAVVAAKSDNVSEKTTQVN